MDGYALDDCDYKSTYCAKNDALNIAALLPHKIGCGRLKGRADIFSLPLILRQITCSSGFQCSSPIFLISELVMNFEPLRGKSEEV